MQRTSSIKLALLLVLSGAIFASQAATIQDARKLYRAGNLKPALEETNSLLRADPKSIPALFLKAQIQSENQRIDRAIETYKKLISLESGHLQAYNNLAALYAQQGKLVLASETLEQAIRTDPVYTTIHTNLRAIYMDMSKKHYRQALKLKPEGKTTQIASIDLGNATDQILSEEVQVVPQSIQAAINTTIESNAMVKRRSQPKIETPKPVVKTQKPAKVVSKKPSQPEIKTAAAVAPKIIAPPKTEARAKPKTEPKRKPKAAPKIDPVHEVKKSLLSWANAWSNRDAKRYVNAYVKNYATAGKTPKDWAAGRRWNFKNKKYIKVSLSDIQIKGNDKRYRASFKQRYESNSYQDMVNKEITFVRQGEKWKIVKESTR